VNDDILTEEQFAFKLDAYALAWLSARLSWAPNSVVTETRRAEALKQELVSHNAALMAEKRVTGDRRYRVFGREGGP
jgi:hypothetical protein